MYSDDSKKLELLLQKSFVEAHSTSGNLCSIRFTQYGDMRSFTSNNAISSSYGSSVDIAEYFDCRDAGTLVVPEDASNRRLADDSPEMLSY